MLPARVPGLLKALYRDLTWSIPGQGRDVYLTFDDGPCPEVTPHVLDLLGTYDAKATFFLIGRNAMEQPALVERLRSEGHALGNHTWDHRNGWKTGTKEYLDSVQRAQGLTGSRLFRPPYGRITRAQSNALLPLYDIVMWDVLSSDFDTGIDGARCARNVTDHARPGSIVVFHDSMKAWPRASVALPVVLRHLQDSGYAFRPLPESGIRAGWR